MPSRSVPALPRAAHVSQLRKVYGPLSPGFVADELGCTLHQAAQLLYKGSADQQVWVRVSDLAWMADTSAAEVLAWIRRHHLPSWIKGHQGRPTTTFIHLADATVYLQHVSLPYVHPAWAYLPRWKTQSPVSTAKTAAQDTDLDWQLAQQAAWPVTVERLAAAVFSSRTPSVLQQTRRLIRTWEAQGKIVCFAKGLYDLVRPEVILDPAL